MARELLESSTRCMIKCGIHLVEFGKNKTSLNASRDALAGDQ